MLLKTSLESHQGVIIVACQAVDLPGYNSENSYWSRFVNKLKSVGLSPQLVIVEVLVSPTP